MHEPVLLELAGVSKAFRLRSGMGGGHTRTLVAVDRVSLRVRRGETLGIVGESGCGKTTLGRLIVRLNKPTAGSIFFGGQDIAQYSGRQLTAFRREAQIVFQDPYSSLNPRMRAGDIIGEPLRNNGIAGRELRLRVAEVMETVGLAPAMATRHPHAFSGGQLQRIGIARALILQPSLLVCDEAVSALDVSVQAQILNLLGKIQREHALTLIFISHNLGVIRFLSSRIAVMYLGRIVELAPEPSLFDRPQHPYTRALISAIPQLDPGLRGRRQILKGDMPNPIDPPSGCHFRLRCPFAASPCTTTIPTLTDAFEGHRVACHYPAKFRPSGNDK